MISAFAYNPPGPPLREVRPTIALGYLVCPALMAMVFANPFVLTGCAAGVAVMARGAGAARAAKRAAIGSAALALLIIAVNGLVVHRGETVLFRAGELPVIGRLDVTAEALVEGALIGARVGIVVAAFAVVTARVDPDYLLRSIRRFAGRSAMTATLLVRLVPLAVSDFARLREARELRGPAATPVSRGAIMRRLISGTLDRAVDAAAALEVRGYGSGRVRLTTLRQHRRNDAQFALAAVAMLLAAAAALIVGAGGFDAYPSIALDSDPATLALAASVPALAALPLAVSR